MSKKNQHSFSSIISVNPYNKTYLSGISSFLNNISDPEYKKDQFAISYINTQDFINTQISISKNIPEEDLHDAIYNKVYDELALDQAVSYQIQFFETFNNLDDEDRHFHVFIVDPATISETFEEVAQNIKYLDIIIPSPLLLKSLYTKDIIESDGVHCFVYLQENDAFVTIYNEKDFIYTKSIKYSLIQMHEIFCELYGERIEYEEFIDFLSTQNLKYTDSEYKKYFIKLYKEIFANVNDILTYAKRAFELEKIDQVYIGLQIDAATKLHEMAEVELNVKASDFAFNYGFETNDSYIDQLHALMHIYTTIEENARYNCNFTIFHRPPKFIQRDSGKLIMLIAASFVIAFIYPITYWILTYGQSLQYELLKQDYYEAHNIRITREATIKNREADKQKVLTLLEEEKQDYIDKKNTLLKIKDVKKDYPMKAKLLYTLTKDLNKFNVRLESLSYNENNNTKQFYLDLVSSKDVRITKLLKYLTKIHEKQFKFSLKKISYEVESKKYFSQLKVNLL